MLLDDAQRYAGIVRAARVYGDHASDETRIDTFAESADVWLMASMNVAEVMDAFDRTETEELAVLDDDQRVTGLISEVYATRRYAKEMEQVQQGLFEEPDLPERHRPSTR